MIHYRYPFDINTEFLKNGEKCDNKYKCERKSGIINHILGKGMGKIALEVKASRELSQVGLIKETMCIGIRGVRINLIEKKPIICFH